MLLRALIRPVLGWGGRLSIGSGDCCCCCGALQGGARPLSGSTSELPSAEGPQEGPLQGGKRLSAALPSHRGPPGEEASSRASAVRAHTGDWDDASEGWPESQGAPQEILVSLCEAPGPSHAALWLAGAARSPCVPPEEVGEDPVVAELLERGADGGHSMGAFLRRRGLRGTPLGASKTEERSSRRRDSLLQRLALAEKIAATNPRSNSSSSNSSDTVSVEERHRLIARETGRDRNRKPLSLVSLSFTSCIVAAASPSAVCAVSATIQGPVVCYRVPLYV